VYKLNTITSNSIDGGDGWCALFSLFRVNVQTRIADTLISDLANLRYVAILMHEQIRLQLPSQNGKSIIITERGIQSTSNVAPKP